MITSRENKKIKEIVHLNKSRSYRRETGRFIVEGKKLISDAPDELIEEVFISESNASWNEFCVERFSSDKGFRYEIVKDDIFNKISDTVTPQGMLAVVKMPQWDIERTAAAEKDNPAPLFVILENIQDPGNAGTVIRTAEACGVRAVFMTKGCVDIYNPKTARSTMGSIFRVPAVYVDDITDTAALLRGRGVRLYAACPDEGAGSCFAKDYRSACAFLIGNEGTGLTEQAVAAADEKIYIPMRGEIESLNASVSASVLMYEALRQREVL